MLLVVLTMIGAVVAPALAAPRQAAASATSSAVAPATKGAGTATAGLQEAQTASPTSHNRPPLLLLGTHDLTWADVLAAVADPGQPQAVHDAAQQLLALAAQAEPVNLVTRTVSDTTCPADGWLSLGAATRASAGPRSPEGQCLWPQDRPKGPHPTRSTGLGVLRQAQGEAVGASGAVGRGARLALTSRAGEPPTTLTLTELTDGHQLPDLVLVDTADPTVMVQLLPPEMRAGLPPYDPAANTSRSTAAAPGGTASPGQEVRGDASPTGSPSAVAPAQTTEAVAPAQTTDAQRLVALASAVTLLRAHGQAGAVVLASVADASSPGPQMALLPKGSEGMYNHAPPPTVPGPAGDTHLLLPSSTRQPGLVELTDLAPALTRGRDVTATVSPDYPFQHAPVSLPPQPTDGSAVWPPPDDAPGRVKAAALADAALHARASRLTTVPAALLLTVLAGAAVACMAWLLRAEPHTTAAQPGTAPPSTSQTPSPTGPGATSPAATAQPTGAAPAGACTQPTNTQAAGTQPAEAAPAGVSAQPTNTQPTNAWPATGRLLLAAVVGLTALLTPVGALSTNMLPWWRVGASGETPSWTTVGAALAGTLALTLAAALLLLSASLVLSLLAPGLRRGPLQPQAARASSRPRRSSVEHWGQVLTVATAIAALLVLGWTIFEGALVGRLALNSPLGMNTVVAGRYYGVNNFSFALGAGALLVAVMALWALLRPAVAALLKRTHRHDPALSPEPGSPAGQAPAGAASAWPWGLAALLLALPLGLATLLAEALGADAGGLLTLVPVLFVLGAGLAGLQTRWWHWLVLVGFMGLPLLLTGVLDLRHGGPSTHLGRFLEMVLHGEAGGVLARKAWAVLAPFTTGPLPLLALAVSLGLVAVTVWRLRRVLRQVQHGQGAYAWLGHVDTGAPAGVPVQAARPWAWLPVAGRTALVLLVVEVLVNDSGPAMAWFSVVTLLPGLLALACAQLAALPVPSRSGG